jgi:hypothetical protein
MQIEQMKLEVEKMQIQADLKTSQMELMSEMDKRRAEIDQLSADAILKMAQAEGIGKGHEIALIEAQIGAAKHGMDGLLKHAEIMQKAQDNVAKRKEKAATSST